MKQIGKELTQIADTKDRCGEGPLWDWRTKQFFWDDIPANRIATIDLKSGEAIVIPTKSQVAGMALLAGGGLVVGGADGLVAWRDGQETLLLKELDGVAAPINDMLATPSGRLYAGTYFWGHEDMEKFGSLYLIDVAKKTATKVDDGIALANGLALSPDGKTLYFADSSVRKIYAYDIKADETLSNKRVFVSVPTDEGLPDGMTTDADGYLWCAQWYGSQVVRYDPSGKVERRIKTPMTQTSSVAFGGEDLDTLFITTAGEHWPSKYVPTDYPANPPGVGGPLFAIKPGVKGRKESEVKAG